MSSQDSVSSDKDIEKQRLILPNCHDGVQIPSPYPPGPTIQTPQVPKEGLGIGVTLYLTHTS